MKKISLKKSAAILMAVMSIASATMITVSAAGNYHDRPLGVTFSGSGTNPHTKTEEKWDSTSAYISSYDSVSPYNAEKYSYSVYVYGSNIQVSAGEGDSFNNPNIRDCTYNGAQYITPGTWKYLPNLVKERYYSYAFLVLWQKKEGAANITGVWSPDSI